MKLIGITGTICSGKSTVSSMLKEMGYVVIDIDRLNDQNLKESKTKQKLIKIFGKDVIDESGNVDKDFIRQAITKDPSLIHSLKRATHPGIKRLLFERLQKIEMDKNELCFIEVPLLFEEGLEDMFDRIIAVVCDREIRKSRFIQRRKKQEELFERLDGAQLSDEHKAKASDFVIFNNAGLDELKERLKKIIKQIDQKRV